MPEKLSVVLILEVFILIALLVLVYTIDSAFRRYGEYCYTNPNALPNFTISTRSTSTIGVVSNG